MILKNYVLRLIANELTKNLLQNKVTKTTTDNAKNFAKAFIQFSKAADVLPDTVEPIVDEDLIVDVEEDARGEENCLKYIYLSL